MRWLAYAQLVRLPNVFTAMADIVLAAAAGSVLRTTLSEDVLDAPRYLERLPALACVFLASSFLYMGGMVWNDWFDLKQDLRERPGRPIPSGRVTVQNAAILGVILIVLGLLAAAAADLLSDHGWSSLTIAGLLVGAVFLYDGILKRTWMGPYAMGTCRFLNVLLGLSAATDTIPPWGYAMALAIGVYIVGVTWFAKTEARMSKQQTLLAAALVMAAGLFLSLTVPTLAREHPYSRPTPSILFPYLLVAFGMYLGMKLVPAIRDPRPDRVQPAVKRAVLGLVVFDAILASSLIGWPGLAIVLLLAPALWLGRWLYST